MPRPHSVALVAMGASSSDYINRCAQAGGRKAIADETWAVNAMGEIVEHDRLFVMDDLSELVHDAGIGKNVAGGMVRWLPSHPGPVYMIKTYPQVPGGTEYPVEDVLNCVGFPYINNSVAYAVAYAMLLDVKALKMFGCDFTYPNQPHVGESGRGCVEWLLGIAGSRGMHIEVSDSTTLMDAYKPMEKRLYGFDEPVVPEQKENGTWRLRFPDREQKGEGLAKPPKMGVA